MNRRHLTGPLTIFSLAVSSCGPETGPAELAAPTATPELASALAGGTWTIKASMPTGRGGLAAAVRNNSLGQPVVYTVGGTATRTGLFTQTVEAYNFATNSWSSRRSLPLRLSFTNGIGVIGGKLYMSGGFFEPATGGIRGLHPGLNVYDPVQNIWTKKADMPKRTAFGVTGVISGKLYVLAGTCDNCGPERIIRRLYRYDPVTNVWTALAWAPNPHSAGAGGVINGKFYVAGGIGHDGEPGNQLDVFDPVTGKWKTLAPMPTARSGVAGAVLQNKLFIMGEGHDDPRLSADKVEAYDPVTNTWSTKTPMSLDRGSLAAASFTFGGLPYILAVGGFQEATGPINNEAYTP